MSTFSEQTSSLIDDDSEDSSNSANFSRLWPESHQETVQFIRDTELDIKKFQIERSGEELEADVADREIALQSEIREITAEVSELRIELSKLEAELGNVKEDVKDEKINLMRENNGKLRKFEAVIKNDEGLVEKLQSAVKAQRENHERNKYIIETQKNNEIGLLDQEINRLTLEIENVRHSTLNMLQKGDSNITDSEATTDMIQSQIQILYQDSLKLDKLKQSIRTDLASLKRELIIYEEQAASLNSKIQKAALERAKIRGIVDRTRGNYWHTRNRNLKLDV